jgi:PAS domain S-box-containing protein
VTGDDRTTLSGTRRVLARTTAVVAAIVSTCVLVGWSVPALGRLTDWGASATSSPATAVGLLLVATSLLVRPAFRRWFAGMAIWMSTVALADPQLAGTLQRAVWSAAPDQPAFGVDVAIILLAAASWATTVDVLDGLPTALAAGAAAVANLAVFGRVLGEVWLATGGDTGPGTLSAPTILTVIVLAVGVAVVDDPRPFALLRPVPAATRWVVAAVTATVVPLVTVVAQPAAAPRGAVGYATTALLVVATALAIQLVTVATQHRDALTSVVAIVDSSPDASLFVDRAGRVVTVNAAAGTAFGVSRDALVGRAVDRLVPVEGTGLSSQWWADTGRGERVGSHVGRAEAVALRPDGTSFPAKIWLSPVQLGGHPVTAITVRDVTDHTEQIGQLRALQEMQEVFVMAISHELRTPLTVVSGVADTLREHGARVDEPRREQLLDRLALHAGRLNALIEELLDVERLRRGMAPRPTPVAVGPLVEDQVERTAGDRGFDVTFAVGPDLPDVPVDPVLLVRVVDNLLSNAAKYAPGPLEVRLERDGDGLTLAVEDHGEGVPEGLREHIFQPFRRGDQLDPAMPGVGIGLALVAGLATSTGGLAWVQDRADGRPGASFRLHLPGAPPASPAGRRDGDTATPARP